jgi:HD-GYP domain-containing protein (c-di-GMP phosphodiesterase class II)
MYNRHGWPGQTPFPARDGTMKGTIYHFRPSKLAVALRQLRVAHPVVGLSRDGGPMEALDSPAILIARAPEDSLARIKQRVRTSDGWKLIYLSDAPPSPGVFPENKIFAVLPRRTSAAGLRFAVRNAFESLIAETDRQLARLELREVASELVTLNRIGVALSTERNTDALLELILTKSRDITCCDAGSLYLVEEDEKGGKRLIFKLTQSDSHSVPFRQFTLPIDRHSIAGYAAATGTILNIKDAYRIRRLPFRLNREFDQKFGYRTKSMLVLPMKNQKDECIGVLQLINAKRHKEAKLTSPQAVREEGMPFSAHSQELAASLASQAAVALENNLLYGDIQRLFEGFVKASVTAIESRDPTTFGHSERVAKLTGGLASVVDRIDSGPYKNIHFSREEIQELRYASLLHDFGKVGVREEVLVKAKKLYPSQLELVRKRFQYIRKVMELDATRKKLDYLLREGNQNFQEAFAEHDSALTENLRQLDEFLNHILKANEPTVLPEATSEKLVEIAGWAFQDPDGSADALLAPDELRLLSIPKGSLDAGERLQIESHVIHSFKFLSQIPWTKELRNVPSIARAHHEKLDGSGYPYHMKGEEIPFQTKMMTISDIFDALTARDRPYKRAVPIERALDIIGQEVKSQLLDPNLFQLFVDAKVYDLTVTD